MKILLFYYEKSPPERGQRRIEFASSFRGGQFISPFNLNNHPPSDTWYNIGNQLYKRGYAMCRNIKTLFNFDPPATDQEIRDAAQQFVRKLSGFQAPSQANQAAFNAAIDDVAAAAQKLLNSLTTQATPHNRDVEAAKARARNAERFGMQIKKA